MSLNNEEVPLLENGEKAKDRYNLVYLIVFFTGIGVLVPWNFFITVKQYFMYKLSDNITDSNDAPNSELQFLFENYLAVASMVPLALTNILNLVLRRYITPMKRFSVGISIMFLMFLITLIMTKVQTYHRQILFFSITMVTVVILNVCCGIVQGSSLGIISMMPSKYIKCFMEGQAISGIIAALANIISISLVTSLDTSALIYFLFALIFLIITGLGFCALGKINFSKMYVENSRNIDLNINTNEIFSSSFSGDHIDYRLSFLEKYLPILKKVYWYGLTIIMNFLVSLTIFPAFLSQIETTSKNAYWKIYFTPVTCFLFFNLADYIGRFLSGFIQIPSANYPKLMFSLTLLRWIFVPLFFMCNISMRNHFPYKFTNDAYPILFTLLLGLSNGYFITLSLIYAANKVEEKDKEAVGTMLSLFICLGLGLGVAMSFACIYII